MTPKVTLIPFPEAYCEAYSKMAKLSPELESHLAAQEPMQNSDAVTLEQAIEVCQGLALYQQKYKTRNAIALRTAIAAAARAQELENWCNSVLEDEGWDASTRNAAGIALRKIKGDHE